MKASIGHLCQTPEHTGTVAGWIYREFWEGREGYDRATLETLLKNADDPRRIPLSLLARVRGKPAGTVNLIEHDFSKRPELTPWLAALVVEKRFRGMGIGSALTRALLSEAARLGIEHLYLCTDIPEFYANLGALPHETVDQLHVMRFRIQPTGSCK